MRAWLLQVGRIHNAPKLVLLTKLIDKKMNWTGRKTLSNSRKCFLHFFRRVFVSITTKVGSTMCITSNKGADSRIIITATAASFLPHVTSAEKQQQESSNHQRDVDFLPSRLVVGPQYHQLKYTNTIMPATCLHMRPITFAIRTI